VLIYCFFVVHLVFINADASFFFFAVVATALPVFLFTTPIFQLSPVTHSMQFAATAVASIAMLVMAYGETSAKMLKSLQRKTKSKGKTSPEGLAAFSAQASAAAIVHVNVVYLVSFTVI
jgi:hypothetical protein